MGDDLVPRRALIAAALAAFLLALAGAVVLLGDGAPWSAAVSFVMEQQAVFHRELSRELAALGEQGSLSAAWALIVSSFLYGVFHAAGPGHGKVVLTTYLVSHERRIGRAMLLSVAAALCQGLVAIVLVFGLIGLAGFAGRQTQDAAVWAERASFVMIALLGLYLVWRSLQGLLGHGHDYGSHGHEHGHHDQHGHHVHDAACGHVHVVSPEAARQARDWRMSLAVIGSVGMRPCSGAVLVLAVSSILHLTWAGALAVLAMSAGTAITVCALALLAVFASDRAARLAGMKGRALAVSARIVAFGGGAIIALAGLALLFGSFGQAHPLGLGATY